MNKDTFYRAAAFFDGKLGFMCDTRNTLEKAREDLDGYKAEGLSDDLRIQVQHAGGEWADYKG